MVTMLNACSKNSNCGTLNNSGDGKAPTLDLTTGNGPQWAIKGTCVKSGNTRTVTATFALNTVQKIQFTWDATTQKPDGVGNIYGIIKQGDIKYIDDAGREYVNTMDNLIQIIEDAKSTLSISVKQTILYSAQGGTWVFAIGTNGMCIE
jgi:hypothetical protein